MTKRQHAFLEAEAVDCMAESDAISSAVVQPAKQWDTITYSEAFDV